MIQFAVSLSYVMPTTSNQFGKRVLDTGKETIKSFWKKVDSTGIGSVSDKRGSYVFSLKSGKGENPWYVGKAAKQDFRNECFTPDKRHKFDSAITARKGTPYLRFVVHKKSGQGKWATKAIHELEEYLIGLAYARNSLLLNRRRLPNHRWHIPGVVASGRGKPSHGSSSLKNLLGVK
jgi:hypothetical protein